jgi:glycosyltransferase involved in cell wall biosynthesis
VICHAPWSQAIFGSVVRKSATPLVFWAHDVMTGRHWTERLARRVVPDLAICNSRFTAGSLGTLYPAAPHAVVYAPVDTSQAAIDADGRRLARACLNTPEGAIAVVQASRLERWKGHGVLVEALSQLRDLPNWVWWQVGGAQRPAEAALLADLKRAVERAGLGDRVRWTGERDDVPTLLAAADIYCQPNTEPEPFGVVFIEALAAALPVVTSRIGGACEVIDDSCGALVEPRNATALAGELRTLIVNGEDRARLSRAAPGRARALCDASTQLKRLAVTLQSLVAAEVGA